jgi:hypothetical protein
MHLFFFSHHLRKNIRCINIKFQVGWD